MKRGYKRSFIKVQTTRVKQVPRSREVDLKQTRWDPAYFQQKDREL